MNIVKEIGSAVRFSTAESTKMHVCIHEDNGDVLVLANTIPPQFTPANKHYAVKTHLFGEKCIEMKTKNCENFHHRTAWRHMY